MPADALDTRDGIIERLVGASAEPSRVMATTKAIGQRALSNIAAELSELVPAPFQIELESVDVGRIADMYKVASDCEPMAIAASPISPDALLLSMDEAALSLLVGLIFGAGPEVSPPSIGRAMSSIEKQVCARAFTRIAEAFNGSGQLGLNLRFPLSAPMVGDDRRRRIFRDGPSARLTYKFWTAGGEGRFILAMPQRIVMNRRVGDDAKAAPAEWQSRLGGEVMRSKVMLEATMSLGQLTLGEISSLQRGQVLELSPAAPGEARLSARDNELFVCEFGKLGQNYTVRIKHAVDPEQELIDGLMPA